jgi:hypothetical protein
VERPVGLLPSLVGSWALNEGTGGVAHPSAGNRSIELNGAFWTARGKYGDALSLSPGDSAETATTNGAGWNLTQRGFSLEAWIDPAATENLPIFQLALASSDHDHEQCSLLVGGNQAPELRCASAGKTFFQAPALGTILPLEQWSHVAITDDGQVLKLYVNGSLARSFAAPNIPLNLKGFTVGSTSEQKGFLGAIDEVRLYSGAVSQTEVSADSLAPLGTVPGPALVAAYNFDAGSGTVVADSTGEHNGTLNGATWTSGKTGNGLQFAAGNTVKIENALDLGFPAHEFSIGAWVRPNSAGDFGVLAKYKTAETSGPAVYSLSGKLPSGRVAGADGNYSEVFGSRPIPANVWSYLMLTDTGSVLRLYLNGQLIRTESGVSLLGSSTGPLMLGTDGKGHTFSGVLDNLSVYSGVLTEREVRALLDVTPPVIHVSGPLFDSRNGALGVEQASLNVTASDGTDPASTGLERLTLLVDGEIGETYRPASVGASTAEHSFVFGRPRWGAGPHDLQMVAVDRAGNESRVGLRVDVPQGPSVALSGPLYQRRGSTIGNHSERLEITAADSDGNSEAPRPGVRGMSVSVDGQPDATPLEQTCVPGNCGASRTWVMNTAPLSTGVHQVAIIVTDQKGNVTTRSFQVTKDTSDPCADSAEVVIEGCSGSTGDISKVREYTGNPGLRKSYAATEWIKSVGVEGRREGADGVIQTRGTGPCPTEPAKTCEEVRRSAPTATPGARDFSVSYGSGVPVEDLEPVTDLQLTAAQTWGVPVAEGPLPEALEPWQNPPSSHGATYKKYSVTVEELEEPRFTRVLWTDGTTGLPVRFLREYESPTHSDSELQRQWVYWSYDETEMNLANLPSDFLFISRPPTVLHEMLTNLAEPLEAGKFTSGTEGIP